MQVSSTNFLNSSLAPASSVDAVAEQTLNQDDFLRILTVQLANQDPLNPVQDTDFIGQMTQFTTLEQTKTNFALILADSVVGKHATIAIGQDEETGEAKTVQGLVTGIEIKDGSPKVIVNGYAYDVTKVISYQNEESEEDDSVTAATPSQAEDAEESTDQN